MRILIVADNWLPNVCGFTRTYSEVVSYLEKYGDDVKVLHPGHFKGVPVPTYPDLRLALTTKRSFAKHVDSFRPDAIHIASEGTLGLTGRRYCPANGIPFTTSYTTDWPAYVRARFPVPPRYTYAFLRWFHSAAERCLVASGSFIRTLTENGISNVVRWGRGVDLDLFRPRAKSFIQDDRPIWMNVGRVSIEKNIRAFLDLKLPGTKYVVGDGPERERLIKEYPDVRFPGLCLGEELARYYSAADVFVFPSRTDTFGLVILEALASGIPVAAFPVAGPLDVIGSSPAGVLDHDLRAASLRALRISPLVCRAHAKSFTWQNSGREFRNSLAPI